MIFCALGCSEPAGPSVRLEPAFGGLVFEEAMDLVDAGDGTFLIAERSGVVRQVDGEGTRTRIVLDLTGEVAREHEEQGLLSIALDPSFALNGYVYLYLITGPPLRGELARFAWRDGVIDPASRLTLLAVDQPYENHNGGAVRFGPDRMLYLGLGDGGAAFDPETRAQDLSTLLGKVLRIDISASSLEAPYRAPEDNPFLAAPGARPEIWALGLRNPWRMEFDSQDGRLIVGDVGQHEEEEIDVIVRGANYGWPMYEGTVHHEERGEPASAVQEPLYAYDHDDGCAIIGGPVYRGSALPDISGRYVFGDLCSDRIWTLDDEGKRERLVSVEGPLTSIAADTNGELYFLQLGQPLYRLVPE